MMSTVIRSILKERRLIVLYHRIQSGFGLGSKKQKKKKEKTGGVVMATLYVVTGDKHRLIDRRMWEIKRQLDQDGGSPLDPEWVADKLQWIIEGRSALCVDPFADWQNFYRDVFGVKVDLSAVSVPARQKGFDRLLVVAQGMTPQRLYEKCAELFPCWRHTDESLDEIVHSDRTAKDGAYAVWFRDRVEADQELKNLSADQLKDQNIPGITLEERLLMELKYFKETGKHSDLKSITLCAGSRYSGYSGGLVPDVDWNAGRLRVAWYSPGVAFGCLRSRAAVSS